jgi:hypothetical protein
MLQYCRRWALPFAALRVVLQLAPHATSNATFCSRCFVAGAGIKLVIQSRGAAAVSVLSLWHARVHITVTAQCRSAGRRLPAATGSAGNCSSSPLAGITILQMPKASTETNRSHDIAPPTWSGPKSITERA